MPQTLASDRKQIRTAEKETEEWARLQAEVITGLMSTTSGRRFVWERLASCHVFNSTMNESARWAAFNEGRRSVGLELLDIVTVTCPEYYILAMREANDRLNNAKPAADRGNGSANGFVSADIDYVEPGFDFHTAD